MEPLKCPLESADAFIEQRPTSTMKVPHFACKQCINAFQDGSLVRMDFGCR